MKILAGLAQGVIRVGSLAAGELGKVVAIAAADGVGIIDREGALLLAGVKAEHPLGVLRECLLAALHGFVVVCGRVLGGEHFDNGAATVPAVGRVVRIPEAVGLREGHPIEGGMFGANLVIACGAILEQIAISVIGKILPPCGHIGGGSGEVILGAEPGAVVGLVDALNIA